MKYIDISGHNGNAFAIIATVKRVLRQAGKDKAHIDRVLDEMTSSDYSTLVGVANRECDGQVEFYDGRD